MKYTIALILLLPSLCFADPYDYLGEYDNPEPYPRYDELHRRRAYRVSDDSALEDDLEREYYETEIDRQIAKREYIESRLVLERIRRERERMGNKSYENDIEHTENTNTITTINQAANTVYTIANRIKEIGDLFD